MRAIDLMSSYAAQYCISLMLNAATVHIYCSIIRQRICHARSTDCAALSMDPSTMQQSVDRAARSVDELDDGRWFQSNDRAERSTDRARSSDEIKPMFIKSVHWKRIHKCTAINSVNDINFYFVIWKTISQFDHTHTKYYATCHWNSIKKLNNMAANNAWYFRQVLNCIIILYMIIMEIHDNNGKLLKIYWINKTSNEKCFLTTCNSTDCYWKKTTKYCNSKDILHWQYFAHDTQLRHFQIAVTLKIGPTHFSWNRWQQSSHSIDPSIALRHRSIARIRRSRVTYTFG